jgi:pimeloyl-ACP methyl ester carboxylesterase
MDDVKKGSALLAQMLLDQGPEGIKKISVHPVNARWLPKEVKAALLADCSSLNVLGVANTVRYTLPELSVRTEISKNRVPTLLNCGKQEKRFKSLKEFAASHMLLLDVVDLDAGHAVNIDTADEFNQAVIAFFSRNTS